MKMEIKNILSSAAWGDNKFYDHCLWTKNFHKNIFHHSYVVLENTFHEKMRIINPGTAKKL